MQKGIFCLFLCCALSLVSKHRNISIVLTNESNLPFHAENDSRKELLISFTTLAEGLKEMLYILESTFINLLLAFKTEQNIDGDFTFLLRFQCAKYSSSAYSKHSDDEKNSK